MDQDDRYLLWKQRRAKADPPADFADKVMAAIPRPEQSRRDRLHFRAWLMALLHSRTGKIGLCSLAVLACAFRVLQVFSVFIPE
jgi:hypothetical protein